jgi:DNA-directed RNA polymerase subunit M/transcription elongation factor TFIIS
MTLNEHLIRTNTKQLFQEKLSFPENEIHNIEVSIFNKSLEYATEYNVPLTWTSPIFQDIYINFARHLLGNMDSSSYIQNFYLEEKIKNKEIDPKCIINMSLEEMFPERWNDIIEIHKKVLTDAYEVKLVPMSDSIKCGKCKNKRITYYDLQTRSGDEAMTTFFNCLDCGNKWKH